MAKGKAYNPLLKSYPDSKRINSVTEGAEVLYVRLLAVSDDAGRYYGDADWVLSKLFTHRQINKQVTAAEIDRRINELASVGLLFLYDVEGHRYLQLVDAVKSLRTDRPHVFLFPEPGCHNSTNGKPVVNQPPPVGCQLTGAVTATEPTNTQPTPTVRRAASWEGGKSSNRPLTADAAWCLVRATLDIIEAPIPTGLSSEAAIEATHNRKTRFQEAVAATLPPDVRDVARTLQDTLRDPKLDRGAKRAIFKKAFREAVGA
jgi:hypothetical protein